MSIQAQLNHAAFIQLSKTYSAMKNATGNIRGSMEQTTISKLMNCSPCLNYMTDQQKEKLDSDMIKLFKHKEWI